VVGREDLNGTRLKDRVAELLDRARSSVFSELPERRVGREELDVEARLVPLVHLEQGAERRALFLIGSPKVRSTSSSIGDDLAARLGDKGWHTEVMRVLPAIRHEERWQELTDALDRANLVVLASPLYVDSLPAPVTKALELIAARGPGERGRNGRGFLAIMNNGFPEAAHNHTALAIAHEFALETGYQWLGGLALGMGGAIDGKPLARLSRMARNVRKALDLTAAALDHGLPVPGEAVDLFGRPMMPRWLYIAAGNWGWKRLAKRNGVRDRIMARPYGSVPADSRAGGPFAE
jgi:hypothetical protein